MVWVFGIVFLTLVAIFAYWLYENSNKNRAILASITRQRRVLLGVIGGVLAFSSAALAVLVAATMKDWNRASVLPMVGTLVFMLLFVILLVGSMLSLISVAIESETKND